MVAVYKCPGAGDLYPRYFTVDLDEGGFPALQSVAGDVGVPGDGEEPAIDFPYTVSDSEVEAFWIIPETSSCICSWVATIRWASEGKVGETDVKLHSRPFMTAPLPAGANGFQIAPDGSLTIMGDS